MHRRDRLRRAAQKQWSDRGDATIAYRIFARAGDLAKGAGDTRACPRATHSCHLDILPNCCIQVAFDTGLIDQFHPMHNAITSCNVTHPDIV